MSHLLIPYTIGPLIAKKKKKKEQNVKNIVRISSVEEPNFQEQLETAKSLLSESIGEVLLVSGIPGTVL